MGSAVGKAQKSPERKHPKFTRATMTGLIAGQKHKQTEEYLANFLSMHAADTPQSTNYKQTNKTVIVNLPYAVTL